MSKPSGPASASCSADHLTDDTRTTQNAVSGRSSFHARASLAPMSWGLGLGSRVVEGRRKGDVDSADQLFLDARRLATGQAARSVSNGRGATAG